MSIFNPDKDRHIWQVKVVGTISEGTASVYVDRLTYKQAKETARRLASGKYSNIIAAFVERMPGK